MNFRPPDPNLSKNWQEWAAALQRELARFLAGLGQVQSETALDEFFGLEDRRGENLTRVMDGISSPVEHLQERWPFEAEEAREAFPARDPLGDFGLAHLVETGLKKVKKLEAEVQVLAGVITDKMILMYNGLAADIPSGWTLCDGTAGTPDLRDKFVRGATDAGASGGANSVTLTVAKITDAALLGVTTVVTDVTPTTIATVPVYFALAFIMKVS